MTANGDSNFTAQLKTVVSGSVVVGDVIKVTLPELKSGTVENTNQASSYREYIATGLFEVGDWTATLNYATTSGSFLSARLLAKSKDVYQIAFNNTGSTVLSFNALVTSVKFNDLDAQAPDVMQMTIGFKTSGSFVLTN